MQLDEAWRQRFIPACAGNTSRRGQAVLTRTVHPRVCGEHVNSTISKSASSGSSPRVRGTRGRPASIGEGRRFIPACAGNTFRMMEAARRMAVHPRVCGEHQIDASVSRQFYGSSPRVRGTRKQAFAPKTLGRFIPACAGNTPTSSMRSKRQPVHPRVCGEHIIESVINILHDGSSPRVRGTHQEPDMLRQQMRFIPACAGNTLPFLAFT